jgi:hypothetical protein
MEEFAKENGAVLPDGHRHVIRLKKKPPPL